MEDWDWLRRLALSVSTADALVRRVSFPTEFVAQNQGIDPAGLNNASWNHSVDEQLMEWSVASPEQWQAGGRCTAYLWGSGRNGQLGEAGKTHKFTFKFFLKLF